MHFLNWYYNYELHHPFRCNIAPDSLVRLQSTKTGSREEQKQQHQQLNCIRMCLFALGLTHIFPHNKINCKPIVSLSLSLSCSLAHSFCVCHTFAFQWIRRLLPVVALFCVMFSSTISVDFAKKKTH